ncbi:uncharacterized protein PF3D7_1120000-like [Maniola hyperantus]|uniref:uncharacterized protein PF3D7_1120000-like n=1 Tax=Aphantopus hyperantus TaxID=2795564 RepID=UPI003747DDA4
MAVSSPPQPVESGITGDEIRDIIREELKSMMEEGLSRMNKTMHNIINSELKDIKSEMQCLKDSIEFLSGQYEDVTKEFKLATETIAELKQQNEKSQSTIKEISQKINILEQNARASNIEIQCLPENRSENLLEVVQKLIKVVGIDVKEEHKTTKEEEKKENMAADVAKRVRGVRPLIDNT